MPGRVLVALMLLVITAAGGVYLSLNYHWKQVALPKELSVGHAATAVLGIVLLLSEGWPAVQRVSACRAVPFNRPMR